jgi:hypothetical protein
VVKQPSEFYLRSRQRILWVLRDGIEIAGIRELELRQATPELLAGLDVFGDLRAGIDVL